MAYIVYSTVNSSLKSALEEDTLAKIIISGELPAKYFAHLCAFFTDVPVSAIMKFINRYGIELKMLENYYYKHIKKYYPNYDLEDVFHI